MHIAVAWVAFCALGRVSVTGRIVLKCLDFSSRLSASPTFEVGHRPLALLLSESLSMSLPI